MVFSVAKGNNHDCHLALLTLERGREGEGEEEAEEEEEEERPGQTLLFVTANG